MPDPTLKRMNAAIRRIVEPKMQTCSDLESEKDFRDVLQYAAQDGFLAGMEAAAKIDSGLDVSSIAVTRHKQNIRATVKRLRKEIKNAS
jgi:hypothetical protein